MARDERARERNQEASLLDRRSYLRLAGASAATVAGLGASNVTAQDSSNYLLYETFESTDYRDRFTDHWKLGNDDNDTHTTAEARSGDGCVHFPVHTGDHYGIAATLDLADADITDDPPQELYASYWVQFADGFASDTNGGKLPGPGNRERTDGGGAGEPADGTNGWVARGKFADDGTGDVQLGFYCYHMDMDGSYGDHLHGGTIPHGEWHHIEQRVRLNTVSGGSANRDGVLTMWLDGERTYHNDEMAFTRSPERGINYLFQVRYGGSDPSPADNDIYIDDWALATERVGHPGPGSDTAPEDGEDRNVFVLETADSADVLEYSFEVDGDVTKRYQPPAEAAEDYDDGNDTVTDNGDGTTTVSGMSSDGHADSYYVGGEVTSITLDREQWTLYWNDDEVTAAELTDDEGGNSSGSENGSVNINRFEIAKSEQLGDNRIFSVQWTVSASEAELDTVEVVTVKTAEDLNFAVTDIAGANASGWDLFQFPAGIELDVSLRAKDTGENVTRETKTVTL